jgi:hypothetical protein
MVFIFKNNSFAFVSHGWSRDSSVGIAKGYGMNVRISIPGKERDFSLLQRVQTGFGAHPASYLMGNGGSFPGKKAAET